jgi:hypothetical protein
MHGTYRLLSLAFFLLSLVFRHLSIVTRHCLLDLIKHLSSPHIFFIILHLLVLKALGYQYRTSTFGLAT